MAMAGGITPLNIAIKYKHVDIAENLRRHGAGTGTICALQTPSGSVSSTPSAEPEITEVPRVSVPAATHVPARDVEAVVAQVPPMEVTCALAVKSEGFKEDEAAIGFFSWLSGVIDGNNLITSQDKDSLTAQLLRLVMDSVEGTTPEGEADAVVALRMFMLEALDQLGSVVAFMPGHPRGGPNPDDFGGGFGGGGSGGDGDSRGFDGGLVGNVTYNPTGHGQNVSHIM